MYTKLEMDWIVMIERLRGLSKEKIIDMVGCVPSHIEDSWRLSLPYYKVFIQSRNKVVNKIMLYLDTACANNEPTFTSKELAHILDVDEDVVIETMKRWRKEVDSFKRWPVPCSRCDSRGSWHNPILENRKCFTCNAEEKKWPVDEWRENGQMVALLHEWGLIDDKSVAKRYLRNKNDIRNGSRIH